ncbi:MAG: hypothetical protein IPN89_05635 [Saprospiraceae bacterium]|nr:hypothetical protein [Saprospiraceae bacterium]
MDFIKLPSVFLCLTILIAGCKDKHEPKAYPMPSEKTAIHKSGEDEGSQLARNKWIELMHGGLNPTGGVLKLKINRTYMLNG